MCAWRRFAGISYFMNAQMRTAPQRHRYGNGTRHRCAMRIGYQSGSIQVPSICCITELFSEYTQLPSTSALDVRLHGANFYWILRGSVERTHIVQMCCWLCETVLLLLRCKNYEWVGTKSVMSEWSHRHDGNSTFYIVWATAQRLALLLITFAENYCAASDDRLLMPSFIV